ncbi:hypothetical protein FK531_17885 [Rhodococcus spelaei]|uniref:Enoyl-CoA hydratase n=1 Tax=Rhodococcus spelaei TaxID=2546320 RepID=A0A541B237_9NOCA|nr:hypothetical protein [Rhodococcus spelaei]TQF66376.1 hypothetical protein FK531_17885 [Rhodococcus spelaei]
MSDVLAEIDGGVATLTLNRSRQRNAFSGAMGRRLGELYRDLDAAEGVRAYLEHRDPRWTARLSTEWKELPWE